MDTENDSDDDLVEVPVTEERTLGPVLKEEPLPARSNSFRRSSNLADAPSNPELQLDWTDGSESEDSDVGVEVLYMYKNQQPTRRQDDQQQQTKQKISQNTSVLVRNPQNNPVAVVDLTQEETDDESHPLRPELQRTRENIGDHTRSEEPDFASNEQPVSQSRSIKEENASSSSRSQDGDQRRESRPVMSSISPVPAVVSPQSLTPPCSTTIRVPAVTHHVPSLGYPVPPPMAHTSQFYQRMPTCRFHTSCSTSEASVSVLET